MDHLDYVARYSSLEVLINYLTLSGKHLDDPVIARVIEVIESNKEWDEYFPNETPDEVWKNLDYYKDELKVAEEQIKELQKEIEDLVHQLNHRTVADFIAEQAATVRTVEIQNIQLRREIDLAKAKERDALEKLGMWNILETP